ncbi:two-component sensor histidine kinase [Meridianimarinicoccus roseus]|uniref:histidine kinase n=1 Tax=Meridianimarinicoccus roseus TaxID=2072018 RepID=A0A2V2LGI0_9RHOB|nr:ATP-binding protein [Meridianimarinicoccus roseus]PWR02356.1 two-component sensor histidine kinase [Meridianimarinicoccus roseus]
MRRPFRNLRSQLVVLIVAALAVAQAISLWLFVDERSLAIRAALGFEAAGRAANVARLLEEAPPDLQTSILRAANSPLVRFELSDAPSVTEPDHHHAAPVEARVRALLGDSYSRDIRVQLDDIETPVLPLPNLSPEMAEMHRSMMRGEMAALELTLSIALSGGQWLNVSTRFERPPLQWPLFSTFTFALTAALILVTVCWFLVTRLTGPLRKLAGAAERLGRGEDAVPLPLVGPAEVEDLTRAFNLMQERLTRYVADRTRVLAAVGHDLRSPLTALRVRAEMVDDDETRESLIESIEEMQTMAEATLSFAEDLTGTEEARELDVGTFLRDLVSDMPDPPNILGGPGVQARLRPVSFRRAVRNLAENAVRYGRNAEIAWRSEHDTLVIEIRDEGPGIPSEKLEQVFDPFFRLEGSRSLETGGHGLGLSIARSIVRAHGGEIHLANRNGGGLVASIAVPLADKGSHKTSSTSAEWENAEIDSDNGSVRDVPDGGGRRSAGGLAGEV